MKRAHAASGKSGLKTGLGFILKGMLVFLLVLAAGSSTRVAAQDGRAPAVPESKATILNTEAPQYTDQVVIKYKAQVTSEGTFDPANPGLLQRLSHAAGVSLAYVRPMAEQAHVLKLPGRLPLTAVQAITQHLATLPEVEYAEPDLMLQPTFTPNDPYYPNQWHYFSPASGVYGINAPAGWDITTGSPSIVMADIDTGITNHVEFAGRTVPGYDFISDVFVANDGNGRDADPSDPGDWVARNDCGPGSKPANSSWHGTHTAGTMGAASNNGIGVAGINWNSKILPVRVLGKCGGYMSDIIDGMLWAAGFAVTGVPANANPAKVLNLSLGGTGVCETTLQTAINSIVASGVTIVVSAGNDNKNASGFTPANCNGVITVAATDRYGQKASYSNYGATVEISAPGGDNNGGVLSTLNTGTQGPVADTYAYYMGTSMAAPHVTGVVSLIYSLNPTLTPAQILQILQTTATLFPAGSTCSTSTCGSGIVNMGAALAASPTAVELVSFTAVGEKKAVTLSWETASEIDNLGFNLYRATALDGEKIRINAEMIPSLVPPGSILGASYSYSDTDLKANKTYWYWLESLDLNGETELHGPITVKTLAR